MAPTQITVCTDRDSFSQKKAEFLAAYRKDIETLPYEKIYVAINALEVQLQSKRQTYEYDRYPLSQDFTNALQVLEEIAQEDAAAAFSAWSTDENTHKIKILLDKI